MEQRNEPSTEEYTPDELIGAVRWCWVNHETSGCYGCPLEHKPCDGLEEALANCVERLNRENVDLCIDCGEMTITIEQLERENATLKQSLFDRDAEILLLKSQVSDEQSRAEKAEAERDAVIADLKDAPRCRVCDHQDCKYCMGNDMFTWRGLRGKGNDGK